ncbi:peptidylprolyl isomerase [Kitasatospora sp. NA04385]|uniref:peptidylprolyl isomerase n=1 Tax=Kitasatospora sp. NA04385 TaxID=2742135 RepID=UPI0026DF7F44|nr:peptidylprolyl isomerase [Kitasatospora sp. NA04385]
MVSSEQRRRQLAREKYERQMQARAEAVAKRRRRNVIVAAVLAVVVVAGVATVAGGVFDSDKKKDDKAASAAPTPSSSVSGKQWAAEPAMSIDTAAKYTAKIETSQGEVTLALNAAKAPHTVNSFVFLAGQQFWDNTKCHRLTTEGIFVLQCGDPTGTGRGGPGYQFADENLEGATYPAGTVAMANSGANTNGSQFFLVYKDTQLPPSYTPFGTITGGLDVLQKIAAAGTEGDTGDGAPKTPVNITAITTAKG